MSDYQTACESFTKNKHGIFFGSWIGSIQWPEESSQNSGLEGSFEKRQKIPLGVLIMETNYYKQHLVLLLQCV